MTCDLDRRVNCTLKKFPKVSIGEFIEVPSGKVFLDLQTGRGNVAMLVCEFSPGQQVAKMDFSDKKV